jgi:hypothetical protein
MRKLFIFVMLGALLPSASIGQTKYPMSGVRLKEFCVCGYNTRTVCDGTYLHYISDCYDENNTYCGYDDQATGDLCPGQGAKKKRVVPKYRPHK